MADALSITLHSLGEESSAGQSNAIDIGERRTALKLEAIVTAAAVVVDLVVQTAPTTDGPWRSVDNFDRIAAPTSRKKAFGPCDRYVRLTWSAAATFSVTGEAHVLYADLPDLDDQGVRPQALEDISKAVKIKALLKATADLDAAFRSRYKLPLVSWSDDVRGRAVARALYYCFSHRGFDPEAAQDALIVMDGGLIQADGSRTAVERWLQDVAAGRVHPELIDSTPTKREFGARVRSKPLRNRDDC